MNYRPEIDGLRAVAVAAVLLFHAGFPDFGGGFVGVDVFFVISGYLIGTIVLSESAEGRFSIARFYERRVRRILPALFTVMIATWPFAWALMLPEQMVEFGDSVVSVAFFVSNILFWQESGYFGSATDVKPLLHTWSLSVEEQFYVLFPLAVMLAWRAAPRRFAAWVAVVALASLVLSDWASVRFPPANFFLLPTRAWEILAGVLCALRLMRGPVRGNGWLAALGLAGIVGSVLYFAEDTPFPGRYALVPVAGTALVILFASPETRVGRALSWRPVVGLGLLSYSTYLWHQPIFAFARLYWDRPLPDLAKAGFILLSVGLAWVTYHAVERRWRGETPLCPDRRKLFGLAAGASLALALSGAAASLTGGFPSRVVQGPFTAGYLATALPSPFRDQCHTKGPIYLPPDEACTFFGLPARVAVFGDSHGVELSYALAEQLKSKGIGVRQLTFSNCEPVIETAPFLSDCARWTRDALDSLTRDPGITDVVVIYRLSEHFKTAGPGGADRIVQSLREILRELSATKRVIFVVHAPPLEERVQQTIRDAPQAESDRLPGPDPAAWAALRQPFDRAFLPWHEPATLVDTTPLFCDAQGCVAGRDGVAYYFDASHPSIEGARMIADKLLPLLSP